MLQSWDKLLSTSTVTELHRDCGIIVRSSGKWFCLMSNKNAGFASRIWSEFKQTELNWDRIVHQNAGVWSSLQLDHATNKSPCRMPVCPHATNDDRSPIWNIWRPLISFLFRSRIKVPRIFLISKETLTDRLESTTALTILNGPTSFFLASRLIAEVDEFF